MKIAFPFFRVSSPPPTTTPHNFSEKFALDFVMMWTKGNLKRNPLYFDSK